jgi:hypothetical protein
MGKINLNFFQNTKAKRKFPPYIWFHSKRLLLKKVAEAFTESKFGSCSFATGTVWRCQAVFATE